MTSATGHAKAQETLSLPELVQMLQADAQGESLWRAVRAASSKHASAAAAGIGRRTALLRLALGWRADRAPRTDAHTALVPRAASVPAALRAEVTAELHSFVSRNVEET